MAVTLYGHVKDSVLCFPMGSKIETDQRSERALQALSVPVPLGFSYGKSEVSQGEYLDKVTDNT